MCNLDNMFIDLLNSPWVHDCFDEDMFETYDHKYYMIEYLLSSYYLQPTYLISPLAYKSAMILAREESKGLFDISTSQLPVKLQNFILYLSHTLLPNRW
jgi:hypothetical protein